MSEVSYLRYENEKNSHPPQQPQQIIQDEEDDDDLYVSGGRVYEHEDEDEDHGDDGEEELNTNEKILTSIYLQSNRKYHSGNTPITVPVPPTAPTTLVSTSDSIGGETDNDSEKDANHALAAIHISDPIMKLKRGNPQSPSPLTDDANGSIDSPDSSRIHLHHDTLPYMSSQIPKHAFDQHEVSRSLPHPTAGSSSNSNPSAFTKQSTYLKSQDNYQHPQHNSAATSGLNTSGSVSYPPSQLFNHRPSATSLGNLNFLSSTNPTPSSTPSFLTDDFLLLTPSQQAQVTAPTTTSSNSSSYHLLTPLIPSNSSNSNDSLHSHQLENQSNQNPKYPTFPSSTAHSVSELYYPLRDLTSLTPNTTSVPSTVSGQQVNSRSSPLQATSSSRKQNMPHTSRAGRGKAHASNPTHGKNIHTGANNNGATAYNKSHSSSVPPGTSNPKLNNIQNNDKRSAVPVTTAPPSSSLPMNSSTIPENSVLHNSSAPSPVPNFNNFNMTSTQQPSPHNGPTFSSNMATIQQVKKKFSSVVKSSGAGENGNSNDLLISSINGLGPSSLNGNNMNHSQPHPPTTKPAKTTQRKSKKMLSHTPGTRLERSVSDLGTSDHLYNDHFANFDPDNFHFSAFMDSHLPDGFKPEVKNRSLSWQHSGSTGKSSLKSKNSERKSLKTGMKMNHSNLSSPGLLLSTSTPDFGDLSNGSLESIFNQPMKKKRTSKGAKFRMFTRVWVPAFNVAGCITQEKNGGWKYVQFDAGLPLPLPNSATSNSSSTPQSSPRLLSKGLLDGKWCRACDMEEIPDGSSTAPGNGMNGTVKDHHHHSFPSNQSSIRHDFCGDNDSDAEFDGNILGIADSFGFPGNPFFPPNSNHDDDDFASLPMSGSTGPSSSHIQASGSHHDTPPILLTDDLDQLDSFLMKRRRDRSDSLDLLNTDRDVFLTLGMNTKLEDSMISGGKNNSITGGGAGNGGAGSGGLGIGGVGVLDDVSWHNIEYSGISLDDCDWNL